jgi:cytochrome c peroxidase
LFSRDDWRTISSLANVSSTPPPLDPSNKLLTADLADPAVWAQVQAAATFDDVPESLRPTLRLGWRLYHDSRLSGEGTATDSIGRPTDAPRGTGQIGVSCASCHDPQFYGADITSRPPNVSNGAGYYDVNGQQTLNVARFAPVFYWNGRTDSLWSQAAQVMESSFSMNGHREKTFWIVSRCYGSDPDFAATLAALEPDTHDATALKIDAIGGAMQVPNPAAATTATFKTAYATAVKGTELEGLAARVHVDAAKAIALYEWFLTSDHSPFDQFVKEGPNSARLTAAEKRGLKLFIGHAGCVTCHDTPLFSDGSFHNIGIAQSGDHVPTIATCDALGKPNMCSCASTPAPAPAADAGADAGSVDASPGADSGAPPASREVEGAGVGGACLPVGAYSGVQKLHASKAAMSPPSTTTFRRCTCYDDSYESAECGIEEVEKSDAPSGAPNGCEDPGTPGSYAGAKPPERWLGAWRTPSLRDVAKTAPYMHDGLYPTLSDVVWHYDQATTAEGAGTSQLSPLNLTDQDRSDLVAFLETLTGVSGPRALVAKPLATDFPACAAGTVSAPDGGADGATDATPDGGAPEGDANADSENDATGDTP